jgi:metal-sulfur cluster biosynthetic enzyme
MAGARRDDQRRADAQTALNAIVDPCSRGANLPVGIVDMGLVETLDVTGGHVHIRLMPTYPGCLFIGFFEVEATNRLKQLPWCEDVSVEQVSVAEGVWTEDRMSPAARSRLQERRARLTQALAEERRAAQSSEPDIMRR